MKSAKRAVFDTLKAALEQMVQNLAVNADSTYMQEAWSNCEVVRDATSTKGPPALRLQSPTETEERPAKDTVDPQITITMRITGQNEYMAEEMSSAVTERLGGTLDRTHRLDLTGDGFWVQRQIKDMPDNPLHEPTDTGVIYGIMQRYRWVLNTI